MSEKSIQLSEKIDKSRKFSLDLLLLFGVKVDNSASTLFVLGPLTTEAKTRSPPETTNGCLYVQMHLVFK